MSNLYAMQLPASVSSKTWDKHLYPDSHTAAVEAIGRYGGDAGLHSSHIMRESDFATRARGVTHCTAHVNSQT